MTAAPQRHDNVIPDQATQNLLVLWIFTLAFFVSSGVLVPPQIILAIRTHDLVRLSTLAFPIVGLLLLFVAAQRTWRVQKFGRSLFHIQKNPTPPGEDLVGTIQVDRPVISTHPVQLRLTCVQRTYHPARRSQITERVIWHADQTLENLLPTPSSASIPVLFHIPAGAEPTTSFNLRTGIAWRLQARRNCGLVSYLSRFEIPISSNLPQEQTPPPPTPTHHTNSSNPPAHLTDEGITTTPFGGAGLKIHLDAARRKPILPTTTALILITTSLFLAFASPSDLIVRIPLIAFAAILFFIGGVFAYIAIYLWLVSQDVTITPDSILLQRRALFFNWSQTFAAPDITEITCKVDGTSRSNNSQNETSYGIQLKTKDNKSAWLASNISLQTHADWLTAQINQTLSLPTIPSSGNPGEG